MHTTLKTIEDEFNQAAASASSSHEVAALRVHYLGRKQGSLSLFLRQLKTLDTDERRVVGAAANQLRRTIEDRLAGLEQQYAGEQAAADLTLPGIAPTPGHLHPMTQVMEELLDIFRYLGFLVYEGPELENDYYNFEALNFKSDHPARDMQDTFFIKTPITRPERKTDLPNKWLMRTHTSNTQVRILEEHGAPVRAIIAGRVFRNEAVDATHEHTLTQLEAIVVDEGVSVANLKWSLEQIFSGLFQMNVNVRLRPGFFPFTEPSYEPEMTCVFCNGTGPCSVCKGSRWIEMGGSGMMHPNVLRAGGIDPEVYSGFAFGMGVERLAMLKYCINEIRRFQQNDIRFLNQF